VGLPPYSCLLSSGSVSDCEIAVSSISSIERLQVLQSPAQGREIAGPFGAGPGITVSLAVGARTIDELRAWQTARAFKLEVYRLLRASPEAWSDYRFRSQLADAASGGEANIAEGFRRFLAADFARFMSYAVGSIEEAVRRVRDGIDRGYFTSLDGQQAFDLGELARRTAMALHASLRRLAEAKRHPRDRSASRSATPAPKIKPTVPGPRERRTPDPRTRDEYS
jgi:four helix bundle protein